MTIQKEKSVKISRRHFLKSVGTLAAAIPCASALAAPKKPNIVYILADDAGIGDFGCYGGKIIKTPNVDQLSRDGMRFLAHYSGSTVCAPSRSVLMTGKHTGHTRVRGNAAASLLPQDVTVAELLKKAGYATGCIGKWGLGLAETPGAPIKKGFDHFFGFLNQGNAHHYYPDYMYRDGQKIEYSDNRTKRTHYAHDMFTTDALSFIRQHKNEPFFLYIPYTIPHVDLDVPDDSKQEYMGKLGPEKPYGKPGGKGYRSEKYPHATFAGMITRMDRDIGSIIKLLDELGLTDDTLVMFSSDNGATSAGGADPEFFNSNGPYRGIKRSLYEGGIIAPMIAKWPGRVKAGSTTSHISGFQDILPTLASLVDVPSPTDIDGISFLPTILGQPDKQKQHEYLYWEFTEQGGKRALREGDWKVVQLQTLKRSPLPPELYNLRSDPAETKNLAKKNPDVLARLIGLMDKAHTPSKTFPLFLNEQTGSKKKAQKK